MQGRGKGGGVIWGVDVIMVVKHGTHEIKNTLSFW